MDNLKEYLKRARHERAMHKRNGATGIVEAIDRIFPELAESEDERIRKALLEHFETFNKEDSFLDGVPFSHVVTWLEKQKSAEWSESDESSRQDAIYFIEQFQQSNKCKDENDMQNSVTCVKWLESFKPLKPKVEKLSDDELICEVVFRNLLPELVKQMSDNLLIDTLEYRREQGTLQNGLTTILFDKNSDTTFLSTHIPCASEHIRKWMMAFVNILVWHKDWIVPKSDVLYWLSSVGTEDKWRPTEEQLTKLLKTEAILRKNEYNNEASIISGLYEDLKKL